MSCQYISRTRPLFSCWMDQIFLDGNLEDFMYFLSGLGWLCWVAAVVVWVWLGVGRQCGGGGVGLVERWCWCWLGWVVSGVRWVGTGFFTFTNLFFFIVFVGWVAMVLTSSSC